MKILVIQTASIGDVILSTAVVEKLRAFYAEATIDMLVKKGCESLFVAHPFLNEVLVWDKGRQKTLNLLHLIAVVRKKHYDVVVNVQRFFSTGLLTVLSGARQRFGFAKNPLSVFFTKRYPHNIGDSQGAFSHEVYRNQQLISSITDNSPERVRLYPSKEQWNSVSKYIGDRAYICVAPASLWFTKQFPKHKWVEFLHHVDSDTLIYLIGGKDDFALCADIANSIPEKRTLNLAGKLSLLESAALMSRASMNFVCDSSPMHLATSVDAPTTAVYCSTIPEFGFGPLSSNSTIVQAKDNLACRPCGLHGHRECPQGNFLCAENIDIDDLVSRLS